MNAASLRVLIADDEPLARERLRALLTAQPGVQVVAEAADGHAALHACAEHHPDMVLLDISMPGIDGLELQKRLKDLGVDMPMIIMTGHADVPLAVQAMKAGAIDFLEKPFDDELLLNAIRIALNQHESAGQAGAEIAQIQAKIDTLSARERQVLEGLLAGHPNKTIAYDLGISPRTVEIHRANLMSKLGVKSLSEALRIAFAAQDKSPT